MNFIYITEHAFERAAERMRVDKATLSEWSLLAYRKGKKVKDRSETRYLNGNVPFHKRRRRVCQALGGWAYVFHRSPESVKLVTVFPYEENMQNDTVKRYKMNRGKQTHRKKYKKKQPSLTKRNGRWYEM